MQAPPLGLLDTLVLFALHDEKGTVHPSAFLSVDHGLRAAVLIELRLRGRLETTTDGSLALLDGPPLTDDLLDRALRWLQANPPPRDVVTALTRLASRMPDLRERVLQRLIHAGVLLPSADPPNDQAFGPQVRHQMLEDKLEKVMLEGLEASLSQPEASPRWTLLASLVDATELGTVLLPDQALPLKEAARFARRRCAVSRVLREVVEKTNGTWEG